MHKAHAKRRGIVSVRADATGDVRGMINALNKDFTDYKSALDEKHQEIARRFDDVVTTEKLSRIDASVGDLQAAVDQANAKLAALELGAGDDRKPADPDYAKAFRAHFRSGDVQASLNKGADAEGGYLAPIEWDRTITDKLVEVSPMRQIARVQTISKAGFKRLYNLRGTTSGWVGETAARPETAAPGFGEMSFTPGEIYANPSATQAMLDDAEVNLEQWLAAEVETEFAYQEGLAFVSGDGTNKPRGLLTFATGGAHAATNPLGAIQVVTAAAAAIAEDDLVNVVYSLPPAFTGNARWIMNRSTQSAIRKLRDADGRQLWQPSSQAGQPASLQGYPITEIAGMPNVGSSAIPVGFGDFRRGYLIVDRTGVRVLRDPYTNKPYVMFYTTKRVGGGVDNPEALKVLKMPV